MPVRAGGARAGGAAGPGRLNVFIVAGTVTDKLAPLVLRAYQQVPEPRRVLSFGACSNSGGPYWDSYCVTKGVDQIIPVDVYVPGCPPRPEALLHGLDVLAQQRAARRTWRGADDPAAALTPDEITERLRAAVGAGVDQETGQDMITVTVPPQAWLAALAFARDELDCDFFDWLAAVDELDAGVAVLAHVYSLAGRHHLLLRTVLAGASAALGHRDLPRRGMA